MRVDVEALDQISDEFVNAALDPTQWKGLIEKISAASGAYGVNIVPILGRLHETVIATDSLAPAMDAYFGEEWHKRDFRALQVPLLQRSGVLIEHDYASEEHFSHLDYYRSQLQFDLRWTAMLGFGSGQNFAAFVLQRRVADGAFNREEAAVFQRIRQKLLVAAAIMRAISDSRVIGMSSAFETANLGCIFFDWLGRVTLVNDKAQNFLGDHLQVSEGRLRAARPEETAQINKRLKAVLYGEISFDKDSSDVVLVSRPDRRPLIVRMQRLSNNIQDIFGGSSVLALIEDPDETRPIDRSTLATVFDLTAREAEVATLLANGAGLVEIGEKLNITYETVRSFIRAIYRKTETNNQSQLSSLLGKIRL